MDPNPLKTPLRSVRRALHPPFSAPYLDTEQKANKSSLLELVSSAWAQIRLEFASLCPSTTRM